MRAATVTAAILVIGNEILSGRTRDANLAWLATQLDGSGIRLMEARVIADLEPAIIAAVDALRTAHDHVFTTGGIGPTHDDITAAAIAKAFGVPLIRNPEAVRRLQAHYADPAALNAARLRMANIPDGATLIDNPISQAPGFTIGNVHVMAGVPSIMQAMFAFLRPRLGSGARLAARSLEAGIAEGLMAEDLAAIQALYPAVEIGSYPSMRDGRPWTAIVLRATETGSLDAAAAAVRDMMARRGAFPSEGGGRPA